MCIRDSFHTFRREAGSVPLKQQDDGTETENQDDELDETLTGMDYIPYTQQNAEAFFAQLAQWNAEDESNRCIKALNAIPENWRNYRTAYALARALENYAIIGAVSYTHLDVYKRQSSGSSVLLAERCRGCG